MTIEKKTIGFLGMGIMGEAMARNLLKSGRFHQVYVWNRSPAKCEALVAEGAVQAATAAELVQQVDIAFACLADPAAALQTAMSETGVVAGITAGKCYVDMSTVDEATSKQIGDAVTAKGGRYLEAPVSGSKGPAIAGQLIILAAGDEALFAECSDAFDVMGKKSLYLGAVGAGTRMKLVVNMVMGSMMAAFAEGMCLAEKAGLNHDDLIEVVGLGAIAAPMYALKGPAMAKRSFPPAFQLKSMQKDMRLALELGGEVGQPLAVAAAADVAYRAALEQELGDADFSAVLQVVEATAGTGAGAAANGSNGAS